MGISPKIKIEVIFIYLSVLFNKMSVLIPDYGFVAETIKQPKIRDWGDREIILEAIKYFNNIKNFLESFALNRRLNNLDGMKDYEDLFIANPKLKESSFEDQVQKLKDYRSLLENIVKQENIKPESRNELILYFKKLSQVKDQQYNFETIEYIGEEFQD
mgnify:CR=1 FL=1